MMKWDTGLLRYDGLDGMGWCFDMRDQRFSVSTGMAVNIRVTDRFMQGQVLGMTDDQLTMEFGNRRKWSCAFQRDERCEARLTEQAVQKILEEAMEAELRCPTIDTQQHEQPQDNDHLCF